MTLRTALVGFGWWGQHIAQRLRDHPGFDLCMVVEPMLSAHDAVREIGLEPVASFAHAIESDAEAIVLTSPNDQHDVQVAAAIAAGKHVFCEKPLSLTAHGARASVQAAREAGLVLGIGHERRFEPAILALRDMLDRGELGTIMHSELAFSHNKLRDLPAGSWRTSRAMAPAAGMTQMGIHLTDMLISFFGPVQSVQAFTADRSLGWETGDLVSVHLQFKEGMTAHLQAILNTPHYIRTAIFGSEMRVEIRNATHPDTPGGKVTMECYRSIEDATIQEFEWSDSVTANLESWAAAISGDGFYPYSDFELRHNIEVLEAIVQSADGAGLVQLN